MQEILQVEWGEDAWDTYDCWFRPQFHTWFSRSYCIRVGAFGLSLGLRFLCAPTWWWDHVGFDALRTVKSSALSDKTTHNAGAAMDHGEHTFIYFLSCSRTSKQWRCLFQVQQEIEKVNFHIFSSPSLFFQMFMEAPAWSHQHGPGLLAPPAGPHGRASGIQWTNTMYGVCIIEYCE